MRFDIHVFIHSASEELFHAELRNITRRLEAIMATQAELAQTLRDVNTQQRKTIEEIKTLQGSVDQLNAKVAELEQIIANGPEVSQELQDAVAAVKELAQQVDDQIPDVPTPEPV
jgi:chromosome segregation ATPase